MLALNLGGVRYPWTSPPILALFAIAAVVGLAVRPAAADRARAAHPDRDPAQSQVRCATVAHAFGWGSIVGLNIFLPQYLQNVVGLTPTDAGLTPDHVHDRAQHQRGASRLRARPRGSLQDAADGRPRASRSRRSLVLAWYVDSLSLLWFEVMLVVIGLGFGPMPGLTQVVVQNSVERHQLGISVGTMTFSRNLLATMMIAVFGAIVAGFAISTGAPAPGELGGALAQDAALAAASLPARVLRDRRHPDGGAHRHPPPRREAAAVRRRAGRRSKAAHGR